MTLTGMHYRLNDPDNPITFGFRRRCAWCGRCLRQWQLNMCRGCHIQLTVIRGSEPCPEGLMWGAPMDRWMWPWK